MSPDEFEPITSPEGGIQAPFPPPPPLPPGLQSAPPSPSPAAPESSRMGMPEGPVLRDRIIVLGRRRSGKTVYLARLYERLWTSRGEMHMAAVDGQTHLGLLAQLDAMEKKRWPASTETLSHFTIDITYKGEKFLMVAFDYPGEVFRRAFMEGSDEPAVRELLDNLDRAAAAIVLVDPGVVFGGDRIEQADQDFGLVAAIKRIREWPGAESVPVAITLTKCDRFREELDNAGGIAQFVKERYSNLHRTAFQGGRRGMVFACSAVSSKKDGLGREIPDLSKPPKGLIEPLQYCLEHMRARRVQLGRQEQQRAIRQAHDAMQAAEAEADRRMSVLTAWLVGGGLLVVALGGIIAWKVLS